METWWNDGIEYRRRSRQNAGHDDSDAHDRNCHLINSMTGRDSDRDFEILFSLLWFPLTRRMEVSSIAGMDRLRLANGKRLKIEREGKREREREREREKERKGSGMTTVLMSCFLLNLAHISVHILFVDFRFAASFSFFFYYYYYYYSLLLLLLLLLVPPVLPSYRFDFPFLSFCTSFRSRFFFLFPRRGNVAHYF